MARTADRLALENERPSHRADRWRTNGLRLAGVGVSALLALGACRGSGGTYSPATAAVFLAACAPDGTATAKRTCYCSYHLLRDRLPYAEFEQVDRAARAGEPLPAAVVAITKLCSAMAGN